MDNDDSFRDCSVVIVEDAYARVYEVLPNRHHAVCIYAHDLVLCRNASVDAEQDPNKQTKSAGPVVINIHRIKYGQK